MHYEETERLKELLWSPDEAQREQGVELLQVLEGEGLLKDLGSLQWYLRRHRLIEWCEEIYETGSIQSPLPEVLCTDLRYLKAAVGGALVQDPLATPRKSNNQAVRFQQVPCKVLLWRDIQRILEVVFWTTPQGFLNRPDVRFHCA
jgi:hypothetical protein